MSRLIPEKLDVIIKGDLTETDPIIPRRYTLTHSDATGKLTLTIGSEYDLKQIAEWKKWDSSYSLDVYCHVSGGLIFGGSSMRETIFLNEMPLVLEVLRFGDRLLFERHKELDEAVIRTHLQSSGRDYRVVEMDSPSNYILKK